MLSMVGAYRLAVELGKANGDHVEAFERYQAGFAQTVMQTQKDLFTKFLVPRSHAGIFFRNFATKLPLLQMLAGFGDRAVKPLPSFEPVSIGGAA